MSETEKDTNERPLSEKFVEARHKKNITLEEASEALNLRPEQVSKLESASFDLKKMTSFERGYARNYAQYLDLDIEEYKADFSESKQVVAELKSMSRFKYPAPQPFFKKGVITIILVLMMAVIIGGLYQINV